jgi:hypothetical protein
MLYGILEPLEKVRGGEFEVVWYKNKPQSRDREFCCRKDNMKMEVIPLRYVLDALSSI